MIPNNFSQFMRDLKQRTLQGQITWVSHSEPRMVEYDHENFNVRIRYYFDEDVTAPFFYIYYLDKKKDENYVFNTSKYESDYYDIDEIFSIALDSTFKSPW